MARSADHAGKRLLEQVSTEQEHRHVRDVPCRLAHSRICAEAALVPGPVIGL